MALVHIYNRETFSREVLESTKPVLVDFWAPWCGPCKMIAPIIEQLATEVDYAVFAKVNVDELEELASSFSIQNIPTIVFIKDGKEINRIIGVHPKADLLKALEGIK